MLASVAHVGVGVLMLSIIAEFFLLSSILLVVVVRRLLLVVARKNGPYVLVEKSVRLDTYLRMKTRTIVVFVLLICSIYY